MSHTDYKNIRVIGFDLDQTLYPKSPEIDEAIQGYIYKKISEKIHVDIETAKEKFNALYQGGRGIGGSKTLITFGFEKEEAKEIVQEALEEADIAKFLTPNPETLDLLNKIKNKYKSVDLITSSNKKNSATKLKKINIPAELFVHILTKEDGSKSDMTALYKWLEFYPQYKPENFLYIGDRVSSDYEKPKELGIQSILVNTKIPEPNVTCLQLPSLIEIEKYI